LYFWKKSSHEKQVCKNSSGNNCNSLFISFSACHNLFNKDKDDPETQYLVSYEMVRSYLPVMVESIFEQLVTQFPEMEVIQERVKHGIIIYKITYKTSFEGEPKIASGLVCVPTGEGEFPVISYQNGTNTLHKNAPSVNPNYELYVLTGNGCIYRVCYFHA
jgi:hypothetical protein